MVHTLPDYTTKYRMTTIFGAADNAELAARLLSIDTYDRRGNVIWLDDFNENLNKWGIATAGTGGAAALTTAAAHNGSKCCLLTTPSDTITTVELSRSMGVINSKRLGFEFSFADQDDDTTLMLILGKYNGTSISYGTLEILEGAGTVRIYDQLSAGYITLDTVNLDNSPSAWTTWKLVVDFDTGMYVRAMLNEETYDISAYQLRTVLSAVAPSTAVGVRLTRSAASNLICYIDDAIVTMNEP